MNIKDILFKKINEASLFGIFLLIWGPIIIYLDYKDTYLYYKYVYYSTYFEYFKSESFLLIGMLCISMISGFLLIITRHKKLLREFLKIIGVLVLVITIFTLMISQVGFGPGFGDGIYSAKHLDEENSREISRAMMTLISATECKDFNDLYDSKGKNLLNIKQNDPESVKLFEAVIIIK